MERRVISGLPEQIKVSERKTGGDSTNRNKLGPLCLKLSSRMHETLMNQSSRYLYLPLAFTAIWSTALLEKSKQADSGPIPL